MSDFLRPRVKKLHSQVVPEWTVVTGLLVMGGQGSEIFSVCMSRYSTITQHRKGVFPDFFIYLELEIFLLLEYNSNQTVYATLVIHAILDAGGICKKVLPTRAMLCTWYMSMLVLLKTGLHIKSLCSSRPHMSEKVHQDYFPGVVLSDFCCAQGIFSCNYWPGQHACRGWIHVLCSVPNFSVCSSMVVRV
jgi:hypothetical protein